MGRRRFLLAASREKRHRIRHVCVREIDHQGPDEISHSGSAPMQAWQDFLQDLIVQVRLPLAGFPCGFIDREFARDLEIAGAICVNI